MTPSIVRAFVAAALLVPALGVSSPAEAKGFLAQEIVRTGPWTGDLTIHIDVSSEDDRGFMALLGVQRKGRTQTLGFLGTAEVGTTPSPTMYGSGMPGCSAPVVCTFKTPATGEFETVVGNFKDMRYFVVTDRATAKVTLDRPGWKIRRTSLVGRRVLGEHSGTGVRTYRHAVEEFRGASLPGGRYGSAVLAEIPCAIAGSGTAKLTDGDREHPLRCGDPDNWVVTGTSRATTWRLDGLVRGVSDTVTRLLVIDFPKP